MERKRMKGERRLDVNGGQWRYKVGRSNTVIYSPAEQKTVVSHHNMTGLSWDAFTKGRRDGNRDGMVTPAHVRQYIDVHLNG